MPVKGAKRKLENDQSIPMTKRTAATLDDQTIVERAKKSAGPTLKQLDPLERQRKLAAYRNFLNRGGPDAPGSKEIPQGAQGCLKSLTFVITGVLPSLERDECKQIIESYGGRVTTAVSGKTDFLLAGRDVGKTKTDKAAKLKVKIISEDDLFQMIRTKPANFDVAPPKPITTKKMIENESLISISPVSKNRNQNNESLWVEKYKPKSLNELVGQQSEKSAMKKLIFFLSNWHIDHSERVKNKKRKISAQSSNDPSKHKAVLLIGPSGSGKTTTAQLVCKALNLPFIEQNASDHRSQRMIDKFEVDSAYLDNSNHLNKKHVLIMDEIDGVSGNEDRGGFESILKQIETTRIPLIFIANDRQNEKVRRLINHCYEIKFDRPSFLNVKSFILEICSREHIRITHRSLDNLISSCNRDIRSILHTLNFFCHQSTTVLTNLIKSEKALSTSPFDSCLKMFSGTDLTLIDKMNLYFHDPSLMPLLIEENFLRVVPSITAQRIELISKAADSFVLGDICSKLNFINNNQSMFFGVIPTTYLHGSLSIVQFPSWFNYSQRQKNIYRHLIDFETRCSLKSFSIDRNEFILDYFPTFHRLMIEQLKHRHFNSCFRLMNDYSLIDDDLEMILNLSTYRKMSSSENEIDSKTKNDFDKFSRQQKNSNRIKIGFRRPREENSRQSVILTRKRRRQN